MQNQDLLPCLGGRSIIICSRGKAEALAWPFKSPLQKAERLLSLTGYHILAANTHFSSAKHYNAIYKTYSEIMELCVYTFLQYVSACSPCFLVALKYEYILVFKQCRNLV